MNRQHYFEANRPSREWSHIRIALVVTYILAAIVLGSVL